VVWLCWQNSFIASRLGDQNIGSNFFTIPIIRYCEPFGQPGPILGSNSAKDYQVVPIDHHIKKFNFFLVQDFSSFVSNSKSLLQGGQNTRKSSGRTWAQTHVKPGDKFELTEFFWVSLDPTSCVLLELVGGGWEWGWRYVTYSNSLLTPKYLPKMSLIGLNSG
jgi:hypothetical protein